MNYEKRYSDPCFPVSLDKGDKVRVRGVIDDDFFETSKIEASSVYVEDLGTYFFPSAVDEEDRAVMAMGPVTVSRIIVRGTVTDVADHEFRLNAKGLTIGLFVDVNKMPNNPLDDAGYRQVDAGDEVIVTGKMGGDILDPRRELVADSITIVSADDGRS